MASKTRSAKTWMRGSCIRKDSIPATARSGCSEKRSFPSAARNSARRCPPAPAPTRSSANPYCTTCTGTPTGRTGRGRRRNGRRACRQHALCVLQAPSSRRRSTECGGPAPTRFQRTVACADTFTVHPEPHLSSGGAVANTLIRHARECLRRPTADIGSLARGTPCTTSRRIAPTTVLRANARG